MLNDIEIKLREYFKDKDYVQIAYFFGSYAMNKECKESDIDIAIYIDDKNKINKLHRELENLLKINVDLILIDEMPATVIWSAIKKGIPLKINNRNLFLDIMLNISYEAENFYEFNIDTFLKKQKRKNYA